MIGMRSLLLYFFQDGVLVQILFLGKRGVEVFIFQTCRYMEYWDGNRP